MASPLPASLWRHRLLLLSVLLAGIYWLVESILHAYIYTPEFSLGQTLLSEHDSNEFWMRVTVIILLLLIGAIADYYAQRQQQAMYQITRLNRLLKFISAINQGLWDAQDERKAMQTVCDAAVRQGGFQAAWVAWIGDGKDMEITACAAETGECLQALQQGLKQSTQCAMSIEALQQKRMVRCQSQCRENCTAPLRRLMQQQGACSAAAFPFYVEGRALGALNVFAAEDDFFHEEEVALLHEAAEDVSHLISEVRNKRRIQEAERKIMRAAEELQTALQGALGAVGTALEVRDPYTAGHERRVALIARAIAEELELEQARIEGIFLGAEIHDIGKISIPSEILCKPSRLSDIEYGIIKEHPAIGYEIFRKVRFPWPIAEIAHQHHERMDGSGYPQGLKGEEICLEARIVAVADVVEAMSSNRPYRPGLGVEPALQEIERGCGSHYDADVVRACLRLFRERQYRVPESD